MKKSIFSLVLLACTTLVFTMCSEKLLDIPQKGVQSEDNSYVTDTDCEAAITAVYAGWRSTWSGKGSEVTYCNLFWMKNVMADELRSEHSNQEEFSNSTVTESNLWVKGAYKILYQTVYLANIVIDKFKPEESETKARSVAEARFFRALCYYELITLWGRVPLIDHVLAPEEYEAEQCDEDKLWEFVVSDLTAAIESGTLGSKKSIDAGEARITQEAAYAVLGKVYLTVGEYAKARDAFGKVINSNLYGLIDNMADLYHRAADGCREYIFENVRHYDMNNVYDQDGWYGMEENWPFSYYFEYDGNGPFHFVTTKGWGAMCPTKKVYDAFVAEEGLKSPRRRAAMLTLDELAEYGVKYTETSTWRGNEGLFRFKWLICEEDEPATLWAGRQNNTPCMRYSDVLLMMAEACVRDGQNGDAYVNEVRARAGLPAKSGVTFDDVKKERLLELCFEAVRFQDLKRWGDLAKELADKGKQIPSLRPGPSVDYADNPNPAAGYQDRDKLLPFPLVERQTNHNITQNEGY